MNRQAPSMPRAARYRKDGLIPVLKAVLIYQNFAAGVRARGFFEKLACASDRMIEEEMWNFNALGIREVRNAAASAARKADVVAVSVPARLGLPGIVRAWFEMWLWLLEEKKPAMVALFDSCTTPNLETIRDYLSCIARRGRIEFFVADREVSSSPAFGLIEEGIWPQSTVQAVLSCLKGKGYCGFNAGDQIAVRSQAGHSNSINR